MNRRQGLVTGIILAASSVFVFIFLGFPFLNQQADQSSPLNAQNPDTVSSVASEIDSCVSNPNSDCDQEMLQVSKYCQENKGQDISFCSDPRVPAYLNNRGLTLPPVNGGANP
jgi:hypothetical protein